MISVKYSILGVVTSDQLFSRYKDIKRRVEHEQNWMAAGVRVALWQQERYEADRQRDNL